MKYAIVASALLASTAMAQIPPSYQVKNHYSNVEASPVTPEGGNLPAQNGTNPDMNPVDHSKPAEHVPAVDGEHKIPQQAPQQAYDVHSSPVGAPAEHVPAENVPAGNGEQQTPQEEQHGISSPVGTTEQEYPQEDSQQQGSPHPQLNMPVLGGAPYGDSPFRKGPAYKHPWTHSPIADENTQVLTPDDEHHEPSAPGAGEPIDAPEGEAIASPVAGEDDEPVDAPEGEDDEPVDAPEGEDDEPVDAPEGDAVASPAAGEDGAPEALMSECLSEQEALEFVQRFTAVLSQTGSDLGDHNATANALVTEDFVEYSNSILSVQGKPIGDGIAAKDKATWVGHITHAPAIRGIETLDVMVACDAVFWQWMFTGVGSGKYPVKGFNKFEMVRSGEDAETLQARSMDVEFDSIAWDLNGPLSSCTFPDSTGSTPYSNSTGSAPYSNSTRSAPHSAQY